MKAKPFEFCRRLKSINQHNIIIYKTFFNLFYLAHMLLSLLTTGGAAHNGSLYFAHCACDRYERQHNRCRDQSSSLTAQADKLFTLQKRNRMSLAKREPFMKTIVHCLLFACILVLSGCGGGSEQTPAVSSSTGQAGAVATLAWNPIPDPSIYGYYIHYGRNSSGLPGSCSYEDQQFVSSPNATITNLDPDTRYYFAVSAYNGLESACSEEVSTVTPGSQA